MTSRVTILGAGPIAGAVASALALSNTVRHIVLVDDQAPDVAAGKALDILQACPIAGSDVSLTASSRLDAALSGGSVAVVADGGHDGQEWAGERGLSLLARALNGGSAPVIFAGPAQTWLLERAVRELGLDWRRAIGSSAAALEAALRAVTALEAGCDVSDVGLRVVGRPPRSARIVWEWAHVAGRPAADCLGTAAQLRVDRRLAALWPPAAYAMASAAAWIVRSILQGHEPTASCFCLPPDLHVATALPVRLGAAGIAEVTVPDIPRVRGVLEPRT